MEHYIATAKALCEELEQLLYSEPDIGIRTNKGAKLIRKTLAAFRHKIRSSGFQSQEEEIHFFKFIKPRVNSYLIFFSVLAEIDTNRMIMSDDEIKDHIEKKYRMFRYIMKENLEFVMYYHAGLTHLDNLYFVRDAYMSIFTKHSTNQLMDPELNTSHDLVAANIMAFDLFQKHFALNPSRQPAYGPPPPELKWTGSKLDLVELIYALQASGAINFGDADLKEICTGLETLFQIKVGDLYRAFHDISNRKKGQIKFVNRLEEFLEKKILELEGLE